MIKSISLCLAVLSLTAAAAQPHREASAARDLVAQAIEAMGGRDRLGALTSIRTESIGIERHLEQSERPEGPWLTSYHQRVETRDVAGGRIRREQQTRNWSRPDWATPTAVVFDGQYAARHVGDRWSRGSPRDGRELAEALAIAPDRLLLNAGNATDLRVAKGRSLQGTEHDAVTFTWNDQSMTLFLNRFTHLPTMLEVVKADQGGQFGPAVWGDVTERHWYTWWELVKGVMIPRQVTSEWNGYPVREFSVLRLEVDEPLKEELFAIPEETRRAIAAAAAVPAPPPGALDEQKIVEVNPYVTQIPTGYNVLIVRQPDGLVVFEATTSSEFTRRVLALIDKRFPGAPIKALVTTSDAWPHIGGVREFVARKIPVYALDLNIPILTRLVQAPWTRARDTLAERPVAPLWRPVASRTTIGSGETRIELVPVRGETGERMMIAAMPGMDLVYTSDLVQRSSRGAGFFMPSMLVETIEALEREKLQAPARAVGMHLAPTPWSELEAAVAAARAAR